MKVIKRDGKIVDFDDDKIRIALSKANAEVDEDDRVSDRQIDNIIRYIQGQHKKRILVEDIQDLIENKIMSLEKYNLARAYITYRYTRALVRKSNTTDESILSIIKNTNKELNDNNFNKNITLASSQRDYIAGEVSRNLTRRILLPEKISIAHDEGVLYFHDADFFVQPIFNCCLINIGDMLDNGTVINGKMIESPKSFLVACIVTTQIVAVVASNQYGGQSVDLSHLGKYVSKSRKQIEKYIKDIYENISKEELKKIVDDRLEDEIKNGVRILQYQINTLMTTNGQFSFVTLFMHLKDDDPYIKENAMIFEEVIKQRYEGMKNEKGIYVTPSFPKLVYVLDENNSLNGGKYDYLTKLAIKCSSKRIYPDYISAKEMRKNYEGNVFSPMGCRSFLPAWKDKEGNYKFEGRFNQGVVSINLPQIGIISGKDEDKFWKLLDERLELCKEALLCRHEALLGTLSDISPIHWQYGAIARLEKGEKIDEFLNSPYSTLSLGYIGIYETTLLVKGQSHTMKDGKDFALRLMHYLRDKCDQWKKETNLGFVLYGTPSESLCYKFAKIDKERFGIIKDVTDKGYYTNSYHVDACEKIDAFAKFKFESQFQPISNGGCISYVEVLDMEHNLEEMEEIVKFIYDNILYAEFNIKSDCCHECGFSDKINNDLK